MILEVSSNLNDSMKEKAETEETLPSGTAVQPHFVTYYLRLSNPDKDKMMLC